MSDLDQDLAKKFVNFLDKKQYERLQFEAEMLGDVENQHPLIMFYYASSIYLKDTSKKKDLLYASLLFKKVHLANRDHLQSLYNMIAVSFKTKVFKDVMPLTLKAYEKNKNDPKLIEGLARLHFYLGNRSDSIKVDDTLILCVKMCNICKNIYRTNRGCMELTGGYIEEAIAVDINTGRKSCAIYIRTFVDKNLNDSPWEFGGTLFEMPSWC